MSLENLIPNKDQKERELALLKAIARATEQLAAENAQSAAQLDAVFAAVLDGTNTTQVLHSWYPRALELQGENPDRYALLCRFATMCAEALGDTVFTVRGYDSAVSTDPSMTYQDDLSGESSGQLVTEATETLADDWTDEHPLGGWWIHANAISKVDGTMNVLALKGLDTAFRADGENAPVYSFFMSLYEYHHSDGQYEYKSYCLSQKTHNYAPRPEAVDPDGNFRPISWVAAYPGALADGGGLTSGSGRKPYIYQSASTGLTKARLTSAYEGLLTDCDSAWMLDMWQLRHANKENSGIAEGCTNYNYQYRAAVAEEGVKRVLITPAQAANLVEGSDVLVGDTGATTTPDRGTAAAYNIAKQVTIESISEVVVDGTTYAAINLDLSENVDITTTTWISTIAWTTGVTDALPGKKDGCIHSLTAGKGPLRVMGVEVLTGCYDLGLDPLYQVTAGSDANHFNYAIYTARDARYQATSITTNYVDTGIGYEDMPKGWQYVRDFVKNTIGILFPGTIGGGSTSYYKSAFNGTNSAGLRCPWRCGNLCNGD